MCLAVPAKIVELTSDTALVDMAGIRREVSVMLLPDVRVGDYVIVHAGFAIGKLDEQEAVETLEMIRAVLGNEGNPAAGEKPG